VLNPNQPIPGHPPTDPSTSSDDRSTSLPLLHSWRSVYLFVVAAFVVWVALLTALQRMFS
jgi:hypothetical protein